MGAWSTHAPHPTPSEFSRKSGLSAIDNKLRILMEERKRILKECSEEGHRIRYDEARGAEGSYRICWSCGVGLGWAA
jgi:hypothetical protein